MIVPFTSAWDADSLHFFEHVSIRHLDAQLPSDAWRNTLLFFAQAVPVVRHAATALSVIYRRYTEKHAGHLLASSNSWDYTEEVALEHYNKAIRLLVEQHSGADQLAVAVTILVSYLFSCIDSLLGKYVQATRHLRGGVELSRQVHRRCMSSRPSCLPHSPAPSGLDAVLGQVTRQLRRLDLQATMYLVDWTPADLELNSSPASSSSSCTDDLPFLDADTAAHFASLEQAGDALTALVAQVMHLRNTAGEGQIFPLTQPSFSIAMSIKAGIRQRLTKWQARFDALLLLLPFRLTQDISQQYSHSGRSTPRIQTEDCRVVALLRLQHLMATTYLAAFGPAREAEYDAHLPAFRQCLGLAREVASLAGRHATPSSSSSTSPYSPSSSSLSAAYPSVDHTPFSRPLPPAPSTARPEPPKPEATFTPEIGLIPILYIIGVKCRHPRVRREAARILRGLCTREAVWDSTCAAMVVERIIRIEERQGLLHDTLGDEDRHRQRYACLPGEEEEASCARRMIEQIPMERRVEVVSWGQVVAERDLKGRVEMYYTFCGEGEWHGEVMIID